MVLLGTTSFLRWSLLVAGVQRWMVGEVGELCGFSPFFVFDLLVNDLLRGPFQQFLVNGTVDVQSGCYSGIGYQGSDAALGVDLLCEHGVGPANLGGE